MFSDGHIYCSDSVGSETKENSWQAVVMGLSSPGAHYISVYTVGLVATSSNWF